MNYMDPDMLKRVDWSMWRAYYRLPHAHGPSARGWTTSDAGNGVLNKYDRLHVTVTQTHVFPLDSPD